MRLIDADALIEILAEMQGLCQTKAALVQNSKIWQQVKNMPTIEPEQRTGKWIDREVIDKKNVIEEWQSARCSVCGRYHTTPYMYYFDSYNYCPNCGADMRGEQE